MVTLSSCTTNSSYNNEYNNVFKNVPPELLEPSQNLKIIEQKTSQKQFTIKEIKIVMNQVGENYHLATLNKIKLDALQQWIKTQQQIFNK